MENKYGEPITVLFTADEAYFTDNFGKDVFSIDRNEDRESQIIRAKNCVNLLAGIPDEEFDIVLMMYLIFHLRGWTREQIQETVREFTEDAPRWVAKYKALLDNLKNVSGGNG